MKNLIKHKIIIIFLGLIFFSCFGDTVPKINKIRTFYKYDGMFFFGDKEEDSPIEQGSPYEIFDETQISENYKHIVKKYTKILSLFIESNIDLLKNFYSAMTDFSINEELTDKIYFETKKLVNNTLLIELPGAIRCMIGIMKIQYIEEAIELDKNTYAITIDPEYGDNVYWMAYLIDQKPPHLQDIDILDDQGVIKYHEWFYESNLKLRVVKQIRDKDGKYYGEIYADYYKLEEYDKLFDKDGNPKNPKEKSK